jgi:tetratricopeptide (TPR) repeat protein
MVFHGDAHKDEQILWGPIADVYTDLKMFREAHKCHQNFVDIYNGQSPDPPPAMLLIVLLQMAININSTPLVGSYQKAISMCQHILELVQKTLEGYQKRSQALYQMADSYYWLNDFGSAIKYYEEALEEMKQAHKNSKDGMDYYHLSRMCS